MIYDVHTSSAMNYYEELGIDQDATEPEIRKAHRRLVKLMHPDAQPDQNLKMLAETQMRRLNSIVATLIDSEQRRQYDEQLLASSNPIYKQQASLPAWRGIPWWMASAVGAVILTLAAVWLWADHMGNRGGRAAVYIPPPENSPASYTPPGPNPQSPLNDTDPQPAGSGVSTAVVPDIAPEQKAPAKSEAQPTFQIPVEQKKSGATASLSERDPSAVVQKQVTLPNPNQPPKVEAKSLPLVPAKSSTVKASTNDLMAKTIPPAVVQDSTWAPSVMPPKPVTPARKMFNLPAGSVIAHALPPGKSGGSQLPPPPSVTSSANRDFSSGAIPSNLPAATPPPKPAVVTTSAAAGNVDGMNPHDALEGEWVYSPKEPEKRKAGFYPPEFIDLKLFGAGDPGNLKGQYSAKYVVTDRPVSPEVTFDLASTSKGSRKFVWQSSNGARGTFSIDPIDERTIRIDWRTTSAVHGPALTSGTATLVRRP